MVETAVRGPFSSASVQLLADRCVQCGLCLPHCPTYRLDAMESESPRGRIAYMKALADGEIAATAKGDLHLDHCLGCRRCEAVCPAGVEYGALLVASRRAGFARSIEPVRIRLARWLLGRPRWLSAALSAYRWLRPALPPRWRPLPAPPGRRAGAQDKSQLISRHENSSATHTASATSARPALFTGCVGATYEAPARDALVRLLAAAGVSTMSAPGQVCCGAAAAHAGDAKATLGLGEENRRAFAASSDVLCLASGCQESLQQALQGRVTVHDAIAYLDDRAGHLHFRSADGRRVAVHFPCTQLSLTRGDDPLRRLLQRIPGLEVIALPDTGCCGAAGLHMISEPGRAARLREPLLDALAASGAQELLSANIGCRLHLGNGTALPVRHPLEFLAEQLA